jgi:hypothetical protein
VSAISEGKARLTLYSRAYCHLCQDMLAALEALRGESCFDVDVVDVDADPVLEQKYGQLVPLLATEDEELCHYFLDEAKVREYASRFR